MRVPPTSFLVGLLGASTAAFSAEVVRQPFAGVRYFRRTQKVPRPLNIHVMEFDLTHPNVSFQISSSDGRGAGRNLRCDGEFFRREPALG